MLPTSTAWVLSLELIWHKRTNTRRLLSDFHTDDIACTCHPQIKLQITTNDYLLFKPQRVSHDLTSCHPPTLILHYQWVRKYHIAVTAWTPSNSRSRGHQPVSSPPISSVSFPPLPVPSADSPHSTAFRTDCQSPFSWALPQETYPDLSLLGSLLSIVTGVDLLHNSWGNWL